MFTTLLRTTILPLSLVLPIAASAARGALKADGIIRVKGADIHGARMTVVPGSAVAYISAVGSKNISIDLPLDDVYLISFERAGCPTKEIYFDTRVPAEMHVAVFTFPFQVTLESLPADRMFAYDGPVGFVRYVHALKDFGYETNYVVRVDEELRSRMKVVNTGGLDPKPTGLPLQAQVIDRPRGAYSAPLDVPEGAGEGKIAPTVSGVPPLVHVVNTLGTVRPSDPPAPSPAPDPVQSDGVVVHVPAREATKRPVGPPMVETAPKDIRSTPATGADRIAFGTTGLARSEETIVEGRRITRIVRFSDLIGMVHEYRKVVHSFGGVYYFLDGSSITERAFEEATGGDATADR